MDGNLKINSGIFITKSYKTFTVNTIEVLLHVSSINIDILNKIKK